MSHSVFSPSSATRWLTCTASIDEIENIPESKRPGSSFYAAEGTAAHEVLEYMIQDCDPEGTRHLSQVYNGIIVTEEMLSAVVKAYKDLEELVESWNLSMADVIAERKVHMPSVDEDVFGTVDITLLDPTNKRVLVSDYKHGKGIYVEPGSTQTKLYAIGVLDEAGWENYDQVFLQILQPRHHAYDPEPVAIEVWYLEQLANEYAEKVKEIKSGDVYYVPSEEACRWCPAQINCQATQQMMAQATADDFRLEHTLDEQMAMVPLLRQICDAVEKEVKQELYSGGSVPNYKLVAGRSSRSWLNTDVAVKVLLNSLSEDQAYNKSLITPPQAEKLLGKKIVEQLVLKSEGKPVIAKASDKRPEVTPAHNDFEEV